MVLINNSSSGERSLPYELPLQSSTLFSPAVGGGAEAGGDAVAISPFVHALHHPVTARLDAASRRLRQLHRHAGFPGGDGSHLSYRQSLSSQLHHRPPVLLHHPLHFLQMASLQWLRCHSPVQRVIIPAADAEVAAVVVAVLLAGFRHRKRLSKAEKKWRRRRRFGGGNEIFIFRFGFPELLREIEDAYIQINIRLNYIFAPSSKVFNTYLNCLIS